MGYAVVGKGKSVYQCNEPLAEWAVAQGSFSLFALFMAIFLQYLEVGQRAPVVENW